MKKKKSIAIMLTGIMILGSLFIFTACDAIRQNELNTHRLAARTSLEAYAEGRGRENFTSEYWLVLQNYVADGKAAIAAATDKTAVDTAVTEAKNNINTVPTALDEYKNLAFAKLEAFVLSRGEHNFTKENWAKIAEYILDGKAAIDAADDKEAVDTALTVTKDNISAVQFIVVSHNTPQYHVYDFRFFENDSPAPFYTVIDSISELEGFIYNHKRFIEELSYPDKPWLPFGLEFLTENYCAEFFATRYLVVLPLIGTGGTSFRFDKLTLDGTIYINHHGQGVTMVTLQTDIIIELPRWFRPDNFQIQITNAYDKCEK